LRQQHRLQGRGEQHRQIQERPPVPLQFVEEFPGDVGAVLVLPDGGGVIEFTRRSFPVLGGDGAVGF